jgi:hypothetical protein
VLLPLVPTAGAVVAAGKIEEVCGSAVDLALAESTGVESVSGNGKRMGDLGSEATGASPRFFSRVLWPGSVMDE